MQRNSRNLTLLFFTRQRVEIFEILSEKNEKCVVYAVLRDVTGIAGFCLQSVLQKCLRSRPHIYWREPHLGKCGGVMLIEEVFVFPFSLRLLNSGNFDLK